MSDVAKKLPINWGLAKNPLNWIIVLLMVLIAGIAFSVVSRAVKTEKGNT